jgi:Sec-independent protein translocase protein TatA
LIRQSGTIAYMPDILVVLIVVLVVVVVWRGPRTIPQIGAMLGRGVKAARDEAKGIRSGEGDPNDPPTR